MSRRIYSTFSKKLLYLGDTAQTFTKAPHAVLEAHLVLTLFSLPVNKWASAHSSSGIADSRKTDPDHAEAFSASALSHQSH